jgi:hypothetical protein
MGKQAREAAATAVLHLLVAKLGGHSVELYHRDGPEADWVDNGRGFSLGRGKTVALADLVDLVAVELHKPVMIPHKDDEMDRFLEGVTALVEANSAESQMLWEQNDAYRNAAPKRYRQWKSQSAGFMPTIGVFGDMPVTLSLHRAEIGLEQVLFYHSPSMVTHSGIVDDWLKAHAPETAYRGEGKHRHLNRTDATNFHNAFRRD